MKNNIIYNEYLLDTPSKEIIILDPSNIEEESTKNKLKNNLIKKNNNILNLNFATNEPGLGIIIPTEKDSMKVVVTEIDEGKLGKKISQVKFIHQENIFPYEYKIIGEIGVDSGQILFYDSKRLILDWKEETDNQIDNYIFIETLKEEEDLINDLNNSFHDIRRKRCIKNRIKENGIDDFKITDIHYVRYTLIIKDNEISKLKKVLKKHKEIILKIRRIKKTSYLQIANTKNDLISLNNDLYIYGVVVESGYGDGLYEVVQSLDIKGNVIQTTIIFIDNDDNYI